MELWSEHSFKDIGDTLGKFIMTDDTYKSSNARLVAQILVEIYVIQGIFETMDVVVGEK
jgi:hypothetical protein